MGKKPESVKYDTQKKGREKISTRTAIFIVILSLLCIITITGILILGFTNYYVLGGILTGLGGLPLLLVGIFFYLFRI